MLAMSSYAIADANGKWSYLGSPITPGYYPPDVTSIAVGKDETPYVIFDDSRFSNERYPTVIIYHPSTGWTNLGSPGFVHSSIYQDDGNAPSITLDHNQIPYVIYGNDWDINVVKYDHDNWESVGAQNIGRGLYTIKQLI